MNAFFRLYLVIPVGLWLLLAPTRAMAETDAELSDIWNGIVTEQQGLEASYRSLLQQHGTAAEMVTHLNQVIANPAATAADKEAARAKLTTWGTAFGDFQKTNDALTGKVYEYFVAQYSPERMKAFVATIGDRLTPAERAAVEKELATLTEKHEAVVKNRRELTGESEDTARLESVNFYIQQVAKTFGTMQSAERKNLGERVASAIQTFYRKVQDKLVPLLSFPRALRALKAKRGILTAQDTSQRVEFYLKGFTTTLHGRGNIIPSVHGPTPAETTINLFAPEHAGFKDPWLMRETASDTSRLFISGKVPKFLQDFGGIPKWVIDLVMQSENMVWVGDGFPNPIKPIMSQIKEGKKISEIFLFPEGNLPTDLAYERRPLNNQFTKRLIPLLLKLGVNINLYPVSMPNNHRMGGTDRDEIVPRQVIRQNPQLPFDSRDLKGWIHEPVKADTLRWVLEDKEGYHALDALLRQSYYEGADKAFGESRFLGAPRLPELRQMVHLRMRSVCQKAVGSVGVEGMPK